MWNWQIHFSIASFWSWFCVCAGMPCWLKMEWSVSSVWSLMGQAWPAAWPQTFSVRFKLLSVTSLHCTIRHTFVIDPIAKLSFQKQCNGNSQQWITLLHILWGNPYEELVYVGAIIHCFLLCLEKNRTSLAVQCTNLFLNVLYNLLYSGYPSSNKHFPHDCIQFVVICEALHAV